MSFERFHIAQNSEYAGFAAALEELRAGRKTSHWIWYVFPQLTALGRSSTAQFYGLTDVDEACAYLGDPLLRDRLLTACEAVHAQLTRGVPLRALMGGETDSLKLVSSLTLFELAARRLAASSPVPEIVRLADLCAAVLDLAKKQGWPRCPVTLRAGERAR